MGNLVFKKVYVYIEATYMKKIIITIALLFTTVTPAQFNYFLQLNNSRKMFQLQINSEKIFNSENLSFENVFKKEDKVGS